MPLPYGTAVQQQRERRGWSREQLSLRLGRKGVTTLWRVETGVTVPSVRVLEEIAAGLNMSLSSLVRHAEALDHPDVIDVELPSNTTETTS